MRLLVIFAHPLDDSFAAALRDVVVTTLREHGHDVDLCDLYRENFDPVMSANERRIYESVPENATEVAEHVRRLRQAEGIVFVFPSWWYGMPAILKGYFDRVWIPGVGFELGEGAIQPLLDNLRLFGVVTTSGAPEWLTRLYLGDPSKKVLMRGFARMLTPGATRIWLSLHGIDKASAAKREAFIQRVKTRIARIQV